MSGPMNTPIDVSVVVLSYDRVHLLERTLKACLAQTSQIGATFEVIVVDNHPDRLAEPLIARLAAEGGAVTYLSDIRRNISVVRNKGIAAAKGAYVAFIDDDEAPDPGWIDAFMACLRRTGADAAFGPKHPVFEAGHPPAWDPQGWRYTLDFRLPADTPVQLFGGLRKRGKGLGSGNAIFNKATCLDGPEPFSVAFGDANGEDTQLLFRLALAGKAFVWCPDAMVREFIETERCSASYMITRMKRGSQHYAVSRIDTSDHPAFTRLKVTALGLAQFGVHAALFVLGGDWLRKDRYDNRIGMAKAIGKLTYRAPIGFIDEQAS